MMGIITAIAIVAPLESPDDLPDDPDAERGERVAEDEEAVLEALEAEEAVGVIVTTGWVE